jgi:hypothetical protein
MGTAPGVCFVLAYPHPPRPAAMTMHDSYLEMRRREVHIGISRRAGVLRLG